MNTFNDRLLEFIEHNCRNDSEFADLTDIGKEKMSRIRNGKLNDHKVSLVEKMSKVFQLNPYKIYTLITGEIYTEQPHGSVTAELEITKKENLELKEREAWYKEVIKNFSEKFSLTAAGTGRSGVELGEITSKTITPQYTHQEDTRRVPVTVEKEKPPDQALH